MVPGANYLETMRLLPPAAGSTLVEGEGHTSWFQEKTGLNRSEYSVAIVLVCLGFIYSVHNLIAPNMTAIAKLFHFNDFERDAYIGGELTLFFYLPGVLGALVAGVLCPFLDRSLLLAVLSCQTSAACILTSQVSSFSQLAWARAATGVGIGGALPVVFSLISDWFPASRRASATAFVSASCGAGVFIGQCVATLFGSENWRFPFIVVAVPTAVAGVLIWNFAEEPIRGGQDGVETLSSYSHAGFVYIPRLGSRQMRALMRNRTNLLVTIQAFPGNIPWGVIIVYFHDFLVEDLGMRQSNALGAVTVLAASSFAGVIAGGFIGEWLYQKGGSRLAIFGGVCNIVRAIPFYLMFGWNQWCGQLDASSGASFFMLLIIGGFIATMASPCTGAMLLNVNPPEMRGTIMAMYSVLDDLSKGFGTLFVSFIVRLVGGRGVAYQISLLMWVATGVTLLYTFFTYDEDEQQMRNNLDQTAWESMVLMSKQRAQQAVHDRAKACGEAHRRHAASTAAEVRGSWGSFQVSNERSQVQSLLAKEENSVLYGASGMVTNPSLAEPKESTRRVLAISRDHRERLHAVALAAGNAIGSNRGPGH